MGRTSKSDTAASFGKNDDQLKEFAKGEDVGHGVDHDCPACRNSRAGLKKAGLHASDIKGLEGGSPPPEPRDILLGPGSGHAPDVSEIEKIGERIIGVDHGKPGGDFTAEATIDRASGEIVDVKITPAPEMVQGEGQQSAPGADLSRFHEAAEGNSAAIDRAVEIAEDLRDKPEVATDDLKRRFIQRQRQFAEQLNHSVTAAMQAKGMIWSAFGDFDDLDLANEITEAGGRFQLMRGFIPDDSTWHCEVHSGGERSHVKHAELHIAIRLATLIALNPQAGAVLNSECEQIKLMLAPQPEPIRHWIGTGANP
jgi:hypothetical protein